MFYIYIILMAKKSVCSVEFYAQPLVQSLFELYNDLIGLLHLKGGL